MSDKDRDKATLIEFLRYSASHSNEVFDRFKEVPGYEMHGEEKTRFLYVDGKRENKVLLVAHADTVWCYDKNKANWTEQELRLVNDNIITNQNGGLGADDRAGCAIVWLLREMGHSILITDGEEDGSLGSEYLMENHPDLAQKVNDHQFIVQFDRKNGSDFKCYNVGTEEFRNYIETITGYTEPDQKRSTDIVVLCKRIAGVNLSIGYRNEHKEDEHIYLHQWQATLDMCRRWLSYEELPKFPITI